MEPLTPAKNLEENFANEKRKELGICADCFKKRFKINTKKRSGYGGSIYELEEKRVRGKVFSCLKCEWVALSEEGLLAHMRKRHPK
jgi:hypothetical protein